jgi:branched-chain amino acid transport system ATP-binding protein
MLAVGNLHVSYGSIVALRGVSLQVGEGEIVAVIGPNGAGKSTLLLTIAGIVRAKQGSIEFAGNSVTGAAPERLVSSGLSLVPEGRHIFGSLTVAENIALGATTRSDRAAIAADTERVLDLFPVLRERLRQRAGKLSGGEQQMLAMARALATEPALLLVDELSMGLAPIVVEELYEHVRQVAASGLSILIVEQFVHEILGIADRAGVMLHGQIHATGTPASLAEDLAATYLGADAPS